MKLRMKLAFDNSFLGLLGLAIIALAILAGMAWLGLINWLGFLIPLVFNLLFFGAVSFVKLD